MKSVQIPKFGGPSVFTMVETQSPPLRDNEIRIDVAAAGVNFADIMMRMGLYPEAPKTPFIPGYEVSGTVSEVGSQVKKFKTGDRVVSGMRFGGYTTEAVALETQARKIPASMSFEEAAAIPVNFLTAWIALHEMARVRKGDRVLIQSAAGGVGVAAVQIAANAGAHVVGLSGSESKFQTVRDLGAKEMILNQDWEGPNDSKFGKFDIVLDPTGGESIKRSMRRLSASGRIVNFGVSQMVGGQRRSIIKAVKLFAKTPIFTPFKLMMANQGIFGLNLLKFFEPDAFAIIEKTLDEILKEFESGKLKTVVGKVFPLSQAGEAHEYLQSRANIGKVILDCKN